MRIWDVDPKILCRQHLLGEHRELHALWTIIKHGKSGYAKHPETLRWYGKLPALRKRHELLVAEMERRGYTHATPLEQAGGGPDTQDAFVNTPEEQLEILKSKPCDCPLEHPKF